MERQRNKKAYHRHRQVQRQTKLNISTGNHSQQGHIKTCITKYKHTQTGTYRHIQAQIGNHNEHMK
jgi:hypothetical protein